MDVDDPLDEEPARRVLHLRLHLLQVLRVHRVYRLLLDHRLVHLLRKLSDALRVSHVQLVRQRHRLFHLLLEAIKAVLAPVLDCIWLLSDSLRALIILTESSICGRGARFL